MTPPVLDDEGYNLLMEYIEAFNTVLPEDDVRRIGRDTNVWKQIQWTPDRPQKGIAIESGVSGNPFLEP